MNKDDFLVVFKDGTEVIIENISNYEIDKGNKTIRVEKNDRNSFLNFEEIRYCGNEFDLKNKGL